MVYFKPTLKYLLLTTAISTSVFARAGCTTTGAEYGNRRQLYYSHESTVYPDCQHHERRHGEFRSGIYHVV
jgi:hypothetical protein